MLQQFGRAGWVLTAVATLAGAWLVVRGGGAEERLVVWTFDAGSAASYPVEFEGVKVRVDVIPSPLLNARAGARALAGRRSGGPSELIEVEIGSVGRYFRGEAHAMFLRPLEPTPSAATRVLETAGRAAPPSRELDASPGESRGDGAGVGGLLEARLAHWRYQGVQLAWPRDVHPVVLLYRDDLWREAGIEVRSLETWAQFIDAARQYEAYWASRGRSGYRSLELPRSGAGVVNLILQQRRVALTDTSGVSNLTDPRIAGTLVEYASWVAGDRAVGSGPARRIDLTADDLVTGRIGAVLAADWRLGQLKRVAPDLAGTLSALPLPAFDDADDTHDAPTASWGGTGVAVPRDARDRARAGRLAWAVATDREAAIARFASTLILPATTSVWEDPRLLSPESFLGSLRIPDLDSRSDADAIVGGIGALLADLATELPPQTVTPFTARAQMELNLAVAAVVRAFDRGGREEATRVAREVLEGAHRRLHEHAEALGR